MKRRGFLKAIAWMVGVAAAPAVVPAPRHFGVDLAAGVDKTAVSSILVRSNAASTLVDGLKAVYGAEYDQLGFMEDMRGLPLASPSWEPAENLLNYCGTERKHIKPGEA